MTRHKLTESVLEQIGIDAIVRAAISELSKMYATTDVVRTLSMSTTSEMFFIKSLIRSLQRQLNKLMDATSPLESDRAFLVAENNARAERQEKAKALAAQSVADAEKERATKERATKER